MIDSSRPIGFAAGGHTEFQDETIAEPACEACHGGDVIKVVIKKLGIIQMFAVELTGLKPGNDLRTLADIQRSQDCDALYRLEDRLPK